MPTVIEPVVIEGIPCYAPEDAQSGESFPLDAFDSLYHSEAGSFWFRSRQRIIERTIRRALKDSPASFLELGCGTGYVIKGLTSFPNLQLTGSELHLAGLRWAQKRLPGVRLLQMNATRIPFDQHFEAIGAFDVIEHIANDTLVLENMHKALKPGGWIFLTVPQHPFLWSHLDELGKHQRRYTRRELTDKIHAAGFDIQFMTSFVTILLPFMYMSRFRQRKPPSASDSQANELSLPRWMDGLFELFMRLEEFVIRTGVSLPFGGSLAVAARKRV